MQIKRNEPLFVFLLFAAFWLLLTSISGSLVSGYHFMDDSLILKYDTIIREHGLWYAWKDYQLSDLHTRFRPTWIAEFIFGIYLKGTNMVLWSVVRVLVIALTQTFLFVFARRNGMNRFMSIVFTLAITLGQQSSIAWMLGPAEVSGIFFLALSLLLLSYSIEKTSKAALYNALFITSAMLMALSKEPFIFFLPALYIWKLWMWSQKYQTTFWKTIRENLGTGIVLVIGMVLCAGSVVYISTNFGYAGVDQQLDKMRYLKAFVFLLIFSITGLISLAGFALIFYKVGFSWKNWFYPSLLFAAIVLPQIVIYAKSGIFERYFLPAVTGYAVLVCHQLRLLHADQVRYRITKSIVFIGIAACLCFVTIGSALYFSADLRSMIIGKMSGFSGDIIKSMNPDFVAAQRRSDSIKVAGAGLGILGIGMLLGIIWFTKRSGITTYRLYHAFGGMLLLGILVNGISVYIWSAKFAKAGRITNDFLSEIIAHTETNDTLLVVADPWIQMEAASAGITTYLQYYGKQEQLYLYPAIVNETDQNTEAIKAAAPFYNGVLQSTQVNQQFAGIAVFPGTEQVFLDASGSWFKPDNYLRKELEGGYVFYHLNR